MDCNRLSFWTKYPDMKLTHSRFTYKNTKANAEKKTEPMPGNYLGAVGQQRRIRRKKNCIHHTFMTITIILCSVCENERVGVQSQVLHLSEIMTYQHLSPLLCPINCVCLFRS